MIVQMSVALKSTVGDSDEHFDNDDDDDDDCNN